jgi:hypothetical protein
VRLRVNWLGFSDRNIDPGSIVPDNAKTEFGAVGRPVASSNLKSTVGSDLATMVRSIVETMLGPTPFSAVRPNVSRR